VEVSLANNGLLLQAVCEFKRVGGDKMADAMGQLALTINETIERLGSSKDYAVFAYLQVGYHVAIFEYHLEASNMDMDGIENVEGLSPWYNPTSSNKVPGEPDKRVSYIKGIVPPLQGMQCLDFDLGNVKKDTFFRQDAKNYSVPCVFDIRIDMHLRYIAFLVDYICNNSNRCKRVS